VQSLDPLVSARKSLSLIHRQKPTSGSNYDRTYVRAHAVLWHVRQSDGRQHVQRRTPKRGPRRRHEADCAFTFVNVYNPVFSFIKILMSFTFLELMIMKILR